MSQSENRLKISNHLFSNEIDLDKYIEWNALSEIIWVDCRFEDLDLLGTIFGSCNFKNCKFNNLSLRKCQFSNCTFQNCQIVKCDLSRAEFNDSNFKNCEFLKSDLYATDFRRCELFQIKFKNSNLNLIIARSVKVWKSKQCIEIEKSSNLEKILKDMNLIISIDQDAI
jgi:uncharacterized protein YjbI with pentapeptide repeats